MRLFKYFSESINSLKAISSNGIWCHSPLKMNDPAESLYLMNHKYDEKDLDNFRNHIIKNNFKTFSEYLTYSNKQINHSLDFIRTQMLSTFAFASFTENIENTLMWSHYASSHTGFALEIDFNDKLVDNCDIVKVEYRNNIPQIDLIELVDFCEKQVKDLNTFKNNFIKNLSIKSIDWQYEAEWRLWIDKQGYHFLDPHQIKRIVFGYKSNPEFMKLVLNCIDNDNIEIHYITFEENSTKMKIIDDIDNFELEFSKRKKIEKGEFLNLEIFKSN